MAHDAFLSYSHAGDQRLARALERALQAFAKPWYQRRALDIFRDEGNLNLSAHLWSSIQQALDTSQFFLYLASPLAAQSPWIAREIAYWKAHRHKQCLIILLTDGDLRWDGHDFHQPTSTAIPTALYDTFDDEPFYLDMRWTREATDLSLHNERFKNQIAQIVATIKDVALEDIVGDEAEQHRRTMRIRNAAIASLAALTLAAVAAAAVALVQRSAALRSAEQARAFASQAESRRIDAETARAEATSAARLADERAEEAARQQTIAEQQEHAARVALAEASTQEAERLVASGSPEDALAHLARALRNDPDSLVARSWISDLALNERLWMPRPPFAHNGPVYMAAFSADGRRVITASDDGTARVWDATTGLPAGAPLRVHGRADAVFSPDGRRLVTASGDNTAQIWDALRGRPVGAPLKHAYPVRAAAFSPDGRLVVTASNDTTARVWEAHTGRPAGLPLEHEQPVTIAHFSPEGRRLVTVAVDVARIWDVTTSQPVGFPLRHDDVIIAAAFSRDGGRVVTTSNDRTVRVWNAATGRPLSAPLSHATYVVRAEFSPDGTRVATNLGADDPRIWRVLLDLNSPERIALAADLAEILGDHQVTALGSVAPLNESERLERMRRLAGPSATAFSPIDTILGRFADARR